MILKSAILVLFVLQPHALLWGDESPLHLSGDLIIFHAGSLSVPIREISDKFNKKYPHVRILSESAASLICARKISDLERRCDVMVSSDYTVIDELLIPEHAQWNIKFAGNEMVIAYTDDSRRAHNITNKNWYEILLDDEVIYGRSDPNTDPCGYRAVFTIQLAENYYKRPELEARFLKKNINFIRPKEVDLLALVETNNIDYIFIYRSVAQQHGLKYITLPDEINLKNPAYRDFYRRAGTKISGTTPRSTIVKTGAPMVYGLTIPKNAPNPAAALEFVVFLLEKDGGMEIMERNGQPSLIPSYTDTYNKLPEILKKYAVN